MITNEELKELAAATETRERFKDTFVEVLHRYDGAAKDKEMLAFVACATMTDDFRADKERVEAFLKTVQEQMPSVWDYIDRELYMVDFAFDLPMLQLLMLLHEVILTTQTIERSVQISREYNGDLISFFVRIFNNAGIDDTFSANPLNPQFRICLFLSLMVRNSPVGLGLWKGWISPDELPLPLNARLFTAAREMGLTASNFITPDTRDALIEHFRKVFSTDPARGFFALLGYADRMG